MNPGETATAFDYVSLGDGSYRAIPRKPIAEVSVKQAAKIANCPTETIYRCLEVGFITGRRPSPRKILINVESLTRFVEESKAPDFWNRERRVVYGGTIRQGGKR